VRPGSASYDNLVEDNYIAGNGLSGVAMHPHTLMPGQFEDLSGNRIIGNVIGQNNIDGDPLDGNPMDNSTTGVLVFAEVPVSVTIAHNVIFNNTYGIWEGVSGNVSATVAGNRFYGARSRPISLRISISHCARAEIADTRIGCTEMTRS
jgi:Periplasmic copper-binding protein (NosD)